MREVLHGDLSGQGFHVVTDLAKLRHGALVIFTSGSFFEHRLSRYQLVVTHSLPWKDPPCLMGKSPFLMGKIHHF